MMKRASFDNVYDDLSEIIDNISYLCKKNNDLCLILDFPEDINTTKNFEYFNEQIDIPHESEDNTIIFMSTNVIDIIGKISPETTVYKKLQTLLISETFPKCIVHKRHKNAILPHKTRMSDVGYDVYIIDKYKQINDVTCLYDTGIALQIPFGYYVEIVPRSSLSKTGYILTNSIGIIDRSYSGNIYVSLTRTTNESINIEKLFPFRCCQLILRKQYFMELINATDEDEFVKTGRNDGGYGSTGITAPTS